MFYKYREFSFLLPIWDLVEEDEKGNLNAEELKEICRILKMNIDIELLYKNYPSENANGDVFVFYKESDKETFIFFNMYNGITDQHNMLKFGLRCQENVLEEIKNILKKLYSKGQPRTLFKESENLTLKAQIDVNNYPKLIRDSGNTYYQHIFYKVI